jgi:hypothetical protein
MVTATINDVFYQDQQNPPVELGETKAEAVTLDGYRFPMFPRLSMNVEEGEDPADGGTYQLGIEMLIDGVITQGTTNWIPNQDDLRVRTFSVEVPKHPVKLMVREKAHSVRFRIKSRRVVFGVPLPGISGWIPLAESETYYYKIGKSE